MRIVPNDFCDFAYPLSLIRVGTGGTLRVRLCDAGRTVTTLVVISGQIINTPILRVYATGTTAAGLSTDQFTPADAADPVVPLGPPSEPEPVRPAVNVTPPSITGDAEIGSTLTCVPGTWTNSPTITRQWKRDGVAIGAATGLTYELEGDDFGCEITVTEIANGGVATATSDPTGYVALPDQAPSLQAALQRSSGLLWQDAGKTIAATEDGDPVRVATCPWTGEDYAAPSDAARPLLYDEGGGTWSLFFDGVDDYLELASGEALTGDSYGVAAAVYLSDPSPAGAVFGQMEVNSSDEGRIYLHNRYTDPTQWMMTVPAAAPLSVSTAPGTAGAFWTILAGRNDATALTDIRVNNGTPVTATGITPEGHVYPARIAWPVSGGVYLSARIAGIVPVNGVLSAGNLTALDAYLTDLLP